MKLSNVIPLGHVRKDQKPNNAEIMLKNMIEQGFVPLKDDEALYIVESAFEHIKAIFQDELEKLPFLYLAVYDMDRQPEDSSSRKCDALCYFSKNEKGQRICSIAVSVQGVRRGGNYLYLLLLHELAHLLIVDKTDSMPHSELFEAVLNELIDRFNVEMGTNLENDYTGYGEQ